MTLNLVLYRLENLLESIDRDLLTPPQCPECQDQRYYTTLKTFILKLEKIIRDMEKPNEDESF
jgi:hypothetical protein